jgi:hypothetical protein
MTFDNAPEIKGLKTSEQWAARRMRVPFSGIGDPNLVLLPNFDHLRPVAQTRCHHMKSWSSGREQSARDVSSGVFVVLPLMT